MKIVRFGPCGEDRPGVLMGYETILDAQAMSWDIQRIDEHFFSKNGVERLAGLGKESGRKTVSAKGLRLGAPVNPGKIVCLGKNYAEHAREFGSEPPSVPVYFSKPVSSVCGPFDPVVLPTGARVVDVEVELGVVIGKTCREVSESEAMGVVAGYLIVNDISDREIQRAAGQWFRAKGADTFCPLGPWLVTKDEVPDPHALRLVSKINGKVIQQGNTSDMIFSIAQQISVLSRTMTLHAGDVIATGTPSGIGSVHNPPITLHPGDEIEIEVECLGVQRNKVVAFGAV